MGTVYHNAHLTISAARASGDTDGFLQKRLSPVVVTWIDLIDEHGAVLQLAAAVRSYENPWDGLSLNEECESGSRFIAQEEPISKRAWTIQERYLSCRKLFFCRDQIYWECQLVTKSEDGLNNFLTQDFYPNKLFTPAQGYRVWYSLISDYSLCVLTYESDIFPALSGLVSRIVKGTAANMATSYCAGLWTDDISNGYLGVCVLIQRVRRVTGSFHRIRCTEPPTDIRASPFDTKHHPFLGHRGEPASTIETVSNGTPLISGNKRKPIRMCSMLITV